MDKAPVVNMTKCDGDGACVNVCPHQVFELRQMTESEYGSLGLLGKFKTRIKGLEKSFAVNPDNCVQCGLCVSQCHERAIQLVSRGDVPGTTTPSPRPHLTKLSPPSPSILRRGSYAWFIAAITTGFVLVSVLGFLLAAGPAANQAPVHQWLGLALVGGMIVHLLLHQTWLSRVLLRRPGKLPRRTRVNRGLVVALSVLAVTLLVSGLGLGGLLGEELSRGTVWQSLHHLSGKLMVLLGIWHIVRHRGWFARKLRPRDTATASGVLEG